MAHLPESISLVDQLISKASIVSFYKSGFTVLLCKYYFILFYLLIKNYFLFYGFLKNIYLYLKIYKNKK